MAIAVVVVLLIIGSVAFHFLSPWYFTPIASNWGSIDTTVNITFWVTGIVFILVNLFLAYCVWRFRHKKGQKAAYEPENKKLEIILTAITTIGVAGLLAPGLVVWNDVVTVPDDAEIVEVLGQQWHWSFRLPGEDAQLGKVDPRLISPENPFGIDPDDSAGQDDILISSPELHLKKDQPVKLLLRSKDVLHNFAVAEFRVKMDMVPGTVSYIWLTPTRTGEFEILCQELCGVAHHAMRAWVVVDEQTDYANWLASKPTYAQTVSIPEPNLVAGKGLYQACAACHGFEGEGIEALKAPKLAGQESWYLKRQLANYKSGNRGAHPEDVYGQQMAAMAATLVDDAAINNVVAHIQTLPDVPAPQTITGNVQAGAKTYQTCAACHGSNGQGIWAVNAPRQAGMSDWYLADQLRNFRDGLRGSDSKDIYGVQMAGMAKRLSSDEVINDLIAYVNSLPAARPERVSQAERLDTAMR